MQACFTNKIQTKIILELSSKHTLIFALVLLYIYTKTTVICLSIGTPTSNKFSTCSKCKINYFRCPKIWADNSLIIMCSNIGTPENH